VDTHPEGERLMLQGLLDQIAAVAAWFSDPVNWSGNDGIPNRMTEHIVICFLSMFVALLIALPIGLFIGHTNRLSFLAVTLSNIGRAVPSYAVMALLFPLSIALSIGGDIAYVATLLAMVLLAIPPVVTTTYTGMQGVERDLLEAARGMGMRGHQVLRSVELPLALPVTLTGIRIASVQVVATATLGAVFGGGGLGRFIIQGQARQDDARLWAGAILVALLAISTELLFAWLVRRAEGRVPGAVAPGDLDRPTPTIIPAGSGPFGRTL
jgi:osmoprotectant transport system permease protein